MQHAVGVIPARIGSTRFPRKMLAPLAGRPLIQWVARNAQRAESLDMVLVATDDAEIAAAAEEAGVRGVMTRSDHPSGTDRIAEAIEGIEADIVVNLQGDEPLLDPAIIDTLVSVLRREERWDMATAAFPMTEAALPQPGAVKAVFAEDGQALYFSRLPIPYVRDEAPRTGGAPLHWHHMGIYAYRRPFLRRFVEHPPAVLEQAEKLEQLRALAMGARMYVLRVAQGALGVDTPEDAARVEAMLRRRETGPELKEC